MEIKYHYNKIILLVLLLSMIPQSMAAVISVLPQEKAVQQGQTIDIVISIDPAGTPVAGAQLGIGFDPSVLKINSIKEGTFFKSGRTFFNSGRIDNSIGKVENVFDAILGHSNILTADTFITVSATVIGSTGSSKVTLSDVLICDPHGNELPPEIKNGQINFNKGEKLPLISNIVAASDKTYVNDITAISKFFYMDRPAAFKMTRLPSSFVGLDYIKTGNDDRYRADADFLQFDVNTDVTVYVVYDDRIKPKASWLSSFTDTGEDILRDGTIAFSILAKTYPAGHVSLGSNSILPGGTGGNYIVLVKPQSS